MHISRYVSAGAMAAVILLGGTQATAQAVDPAAGLPDSDDLATGGGEIIVTAQKRSERLVDVPLSISVASGEQLIAAGISSTLDLQQVSPGIMTVTNGIGFVPSIRGVQSTGTSPGDEGNVAIYLDDVSLSSPLAGFFDLADVERIEVLKGPQGTLFGRNATGGAIRIITKKPTFDLEGRIAADYGFRFDELRLNGYVSGPITGNVAASVAASYRKGGAFIDGIGPNVGRTYGGFDNYLVRGKLLLEPTPELEILLAADTSRTRNNAAFSTGVHGVNPYPGSVFNGPYTFAGSTQPIIEARGWGLSADIKWDAGGGVNVRSITAYRKIDLDSQADVDRTSLSLQSVQIGQYQKSFSQEFNVSGPSDNTLSWIAGAYYYNSTAGNPYFRFFLGDAPGGMLAADFNNRVKSEAFSAFGELTLHATDRFHLTGGLRWNTEKKDFRYRDSVSFFPLMSTDSSRRWNSTVYRVVARYELGDDANVYASVGNGFKSGVYNAYAFLDAPVNPENIQAYEIGAKANLHGVNLAAAAFAYDYDSLQLSAYTTVNGLVLVTLANATTAKMRGFEFTANGQIAPGLTIGAGVSWQPVAKYGDFRNAQVTRPIPGSVGPVVAEVVVPFDASGSRMIRSPEVTANLNLGYQADLWGGRFNGTVNAYYNSGFYWQPGNLTPEADYTVVNARLSWTDVKRGLTISVWGENLTNEVYSVDVSAQELGGDSRSLSRPREIGVGLALQF